MIDTTESQQHAFWAIMFSVTTCSAIASLLIILSYLLLPKTRNTSNRIIVSLSIADLGTSLCGPVCAKYLLSASLASLPARAGLCLFQATAITYFSLASICWLGVIAINNYILVVHKTTPSTRMEVIFHVVCWGSSLAPTLLALLSDSFGFYDMLWCSYTQSHLLEAIICLAVYILPVLVIITYCYSTIICQIRRNKAKMVHQKTFRTSTAFKNDGMAIARMTGFIVIYVITWFPYFLSFVVSYMSPTSSFFQLQVFMSALAHSQGVSNFFLYFLNKQFLQILRTALASRFPSWLEMFTDMKIVPSAASSAAPTPATTPRGTLRSVHVYPPSIPLSDTPYSTPFPTPPGTPPPLRVLQPLSSVCNSEPSPWLPPAPAPSTILPDPPPVVAGPAAC